MTLVEFLEARIAEDEAEARVAQSEFAHGGYGCYGPARVLAECAAKREIITLANQATQIEKDCDNYEWQGTVEQDEPWTGDAILMTLAAVYKDHPDYQQEWDPAT